MSKKYKYISRKGEFKELSPSDKITPDQLRDIILDSTEIKISKTNIKYKDGKKVSGGKSKIEVFDRITGNKLSLSKFRKYTGIDKPTISYLKTKEFEEKFKTLPSTARINEFVESLLDIHKFKLPISTEHAESFIGGYKTYWNLEGPISKSELNERIQELESSLAEKPYLIKLKFQYVKQEIYIKEEGHIAEWINQYIDSGGTIGKSYTDPNGNFVLMSS